MVEKTITGRRRPRGLSAFGIGIVGAAVTASLGIVPPPAAHAVDYPTWGDVQKAKQSVADKKKMVERIDSAVQGLQDQVDQATIASMKADNDYQGAEVKLAQATARAASLQKQSASAAKTAQTSQMRAGLLASHLARTGGGDVTLDLFLHGGGNGTQADNLLYRLGTMSKLTEQTRTIYAAAVSDHNAAQSLAGQARQARDARARLAEAAKQALQSAKDAQTSAQGALRTQQTESDKLATQLASLRNTSVATERAYLQGVAVRRAQAAELAAEVAARRQAEQQAAAQAAARRAAQRSSSQGGGAGAGGGSAVTSVAGGGSVGSAPAPAAVNSSDPAPSGTAVARAIAFAKAQLGDPYVLGGAGPNVWDCSGLVMMAYRAAGIDVGAHWVPSQYATMAARGLLVPYSQRQPGDILFWSSGPNDIYHDAIYLGGGMMIAAPTVGDVVKIQPVWGQGGDLMSVVGRPAA